jgi:hypothetical protein
MARRTSKSVRLATLAVGASALLVGFGAAPSKTLVLRVTPHPGGIVSGSQIVCGSRCRARIRRGAVVSLKVTPRENFEFSSWRGGCVGTAPTCVLAVERAVVVRPSFARIPGTVRVVVGGAGTVVSEPAAIRCVQGGPLVGCGRELGRGQKIQLVARAADGSVFRKWGGACSEATSDRCRLTVAPLAEVTATFGRQSPLPGNHVLRLEETRGGFTSQPAGIDCPPTCSSEFSGGTVVTLNSVSGYRLWLAECFGSGSFCAVSVDAPTRVDPAPPFPPSVPPVPVGFVDLTVSGRGVVVGSDGLSCGGRSRACSARVRTGVVYLEARPLRGARFGGWRGSCGGRKLRCRLPVNTREAKAVNAFFR